MTKAIHRFLDPSCPDFVSPPQWEDLPSLSGVLVVIRLVSNDGWFVLLFPPFLRSSELLVGVRLLQQAGNEKGQGQGGIPLPFFIVGLRLRSCLL